MVETLNLFRNLYRRWISRLDEPARDEIAAAFRFRYVCFKDLLDSNTQVLNIITDLEGKLEGRQVFGMSYVRSQSARAAFHAFRMIKSLDVLSGHKYPLLYEVLDRINARIKEPLGEKKELPVTDLILPYSRITKEMVDWVGGKSAHLGEVLNSVHLPIPAGFAITTHAFEAFLAHNDLRDEINKRKMALDPQVPQTLAQVSEEIQQLINGAQLPPALKEAIISAYEEMAQALRPSGNLDFSLRVSMRSSAIGEDSELSYAGQYSTILNVTKDKLLEAYKDILASLYTPRAISYRLNKGIRDEDTAMSVACLQMVDSVASGVMYSHHPFNVLQDHIIISAVWGLGPYAVEGVITPDTYQVAKDPDFTILKTQISHKPVQLVSDLKGGLKEIKVAPENMDQPCLTSEQIKTLAAYAVKLDEHYRGPQDVEWALNAQGRLLVLQTRPLRLQPPALDRLETVPPVSGYPVLVAGGAVAYPGVGCGPAYQVLSDEDLLNFPDGAVLVARHSSPKFVLVMPKAQAIITDSGSISGHMASLSREFAVPTILGTKTATAAIAGGQEITVDAYTARVYQGKVPELLTLQQSRQSHMQETPVYQTLKKVAEHIVPLHLVDPKSPDFTAQACSSLHDLGRLVHELSYTEMFKISDLVSNQGGGALKLDAPIPLDLYLIDLGGGLTGVAARATKVTVDQVASAPLKALLKGMLHEGLGAWEPRPIQFAGLFAVMREQMLSTPDIAERFGERSYAIVSDKYLNFSSRVGYHYSVLDAYCGLTVNKNYITFSFKGGAADDVRRNRRVRAIAIVLIGLDFAVEVKGDRVDARLQKYEAPVIAEKLDLIGRLLQFTRQMDMLMTSEVSVEAVATNFLAGNYSLDLTEVAP
ncbi:MAG: PEP/pyruvate-binding domain-containing protein [Desulfobaccales bacterium]|nr:PEP/pyruvate-binding domain-containing protein [Desulfobaccales bacterium]